MTAAAVLDSINARIARALAAQPPREPGQEVALGYARVSSDPYDRGWSVEGQVDKIVADCARNGWHLAGIRVDNDRGASEYSTKQRPEFEGLVADMRRGVCTVLVYWEASRTQRDLGVYVEMRKISQELGIRWFYNGTLYDVSKYDDKFRTALDVVLAEREVDVMRHRVLDGILKAAKDGRPHGGVAPYGYYRVYDSRTREFVAQEIDDELHEAVGSDGRTEQYTKAGIAREIIARLGGSDSCWNVAKTLNERGIPGPEGRGWSNYRVRSIATNPAYAGKRVHQGKVFGDGSWCGLVDVETHLAAKRRMEDPKRKPARPNKAVNLLSYLARCGPCGEVLSCANRPRTPTRAPYKVYRCSRGPCVTIHRERLDAYVESVIIERLSDPATLDWLVRPDDTEAQRAAAQAVSKRAELEEWKAQAKLGKVTPSDFADIAEGIRQQIAELEAKASPEYVPTALRGLIGDQAAAAWDALDLRDKREVLRSIMTVELLPTGPGRRKFDPARVRITWLLDGEKPAAREARKTA